MLVVMFMPKDKILIIKIYVCTFNKIYFPEIKPTHAIKIKLIIINIALIIYFADY